MNMSQSEAEDTLSAKSDTVLATASAALVAAEAMDDPNDEAQPKSEEDDPPDWSAMELDCKTMAVASS